MLTKTLADKKFPSDLPLDGQMHRFDRDGSLNGWFTGTTLSSGIQVAHFGDWKTGESYSWHSKEGEEGSLSPEELERIQEELELHRQKIEEAKKQAQAAAAKEVQEYLNTCNKTDQHPYMERKGLNGQVTIFTDQQGNLVIPMKKQTGDTVNCQKIFSNGTKLFWAGGQIKGTSFVFPGKESKGVFVCEGWATGASLHIATGCTVYVAFNTANLGTVARQVSERYPKRNVIVAADNDAWTKKNGKPWNPGIEYAEEAAFDIGGLIAIPEFKDTATKPTDFNDLHVLEGVKAVVACLHKADKTERQKKLERVPEDPGVSVEPAPAAPPKRRSRKLTEKEIVDLVIESYGENLRQQEKDLFFFDKTHWRPLQYADTNRIKMQIQATGGGKLHANEIERAYKQLLFYVPNFPANINIYAPRPDCVNFLNGTLQVNRSSEHVYSKVFTEHRKEDYLVNVIPHEYNPGAGAKNEAFLEMLDRIFQGDPDKEGKIRAVRQMFGACLMPLFPRFFLLHGPSGGGKSTLLIAASRLVSKENMCSVEPHEFHGFNMDTMAGKLVNLVTDIDMHRPINDANLKKVIDRMPIKIDRKFKQALHAPLPAAHIFGANAIPPTLEGGSRAHNRRWTFIRMEELNVPKEERKLDYGNWVFDQGPQGILNFALEGLEDLLSNGGQYFVPDSGAKDMEDWSTENDVFAQFLKDIRENTLDLPSKDELVIESDAWIERKAIWDSFRAWFEEAHPGKRDCPGRNNLYQALSDRGFASIKRRGYWGFNGIRRRVDETSQF